MVTKHSRSPLLQLWSWTCLWFIGCMLVCSFSIPLLLLYYHHLTLNVQRLTWHRRRRSKTNQSWVVAKLRSDLLGGSLKTGCKNRFLCFSERVTWGFLQFFVPLQMTMVLLLAACLFYLRRRRSCFLDTYCRVIRTQFTNLSFVHYLFTGAMISWPRCSRSIKLCCSKEQTKRNEDGDMHRRAV